MLLQTLSLLLKENLPGYGSHHSVILRMRQTPRVAETRWEEGGTWHYEAAESTYPESTLSPDALL